MQVEIMNFLEKQNIPLGVSEIADALGLDKVNVSKAIRQLLKYHEICALEIDRHDAKTRFNAKHRMRLYYVEKITRHK